MKICLQHMFDVLREINKLFLIKIKNKLYYYGSMMCVEVIFDFDQNIFQELFYGRFTTLRVEFHK